MQIVYLVNIMVYVQKVREVEASKEENQKKQQKQQE